MKKTIHAVLIAISALLLTVSCKKKNTEPTPNTPQNSGDIVMQNNTFSPATLTIAVNTTIKWANNDGFAHTVTSNTNLFDSGNINSGGSYSHQFTSAGTYPYRCTIHSSMTGTITVQ